MNTEIKRAMDFAVSVANAVSHPSLSFDWDVVAGTVGNGETLSITCKCANDVLLDNAKFYLDDVAQLAEKFLGKPYVMRMKGGGVFSAFFHF